MITTSPLLERADAPAPTAAAPVLPDPGTRVRVVTTKGSYTGTLLVSSPGSVRIKDGAGMWYLDAAEMLSVTPLAPRARTRPSPAHVARMIRDEETRVARLFSRWP